MRRLEGDWLGRAWMLRLRSVEEVFRVDTAGVHAMASRWGASVADLDEIVAPSGLGLSCQTSAAAVNAAHADVAVFTAGLAARVDERATGVTQDATRYLAQQAASTAAVATVFQPAISE